jgi:hypothetical protein
MEKVKQATPATQAPLKLYDLFYRKERKVTAQPYAVCVGEKNKLLSSNCYLRAFFDIKLHA